MKRFLIGFLLVLSAAAWADGWKAAHPDYAWSFPEDHWARPGYKTEWWYFTGHLEAASGRRFGYQFTFFRVGLAPEEPALDSRWATKNVIMGHAAISDLSTGRHVFSEVLYRAVPMLGGFGTFPDSTIAWSRGPAGTKTEWTLRWNGKAFDFAMADRAQEIAFELSTTPAKDRIFQGPGGYSKKGAGASAASQYYSFTRLETEGTVRVGPDTVRVRGLSWMDKEFGSNQLEEHQVGWDWFSLQLDNGREVMLYLLRDRSGAVDFARGTVVSPNGRVQYLEPEEFTVRSTKRWTSPETGATYPAHWEVEIPQEELRMRIVPELANQENRSRRMKTMFYWEGAVEITGTKGRIGQGYVELVGYGEGSQPRI